MTWRDMLEYINEMPERFLDTTIQVFDVANDKTLIDGMFVTDCDDTDYLIDLDQPQIWVNFDEFNIE